MHKHLAVWASSLPAWVPVGGWGLQFGVGLAAECGAGLPGCCAVFLLHFRVVLHAVLRHAPLFGCAAQACKVCKPRQQQLLQKLPEHAMLVRLRCVGRYHAASLALQQWCAVLKAVLCECSCNGLQPALRQVDGVAKGAAASPQPLLLLGIHCMRGTKQIRRTCCCCWAALRIAQLSRFKRRITHVR